jgi:hypothetical protein
MAQLHLRNPAFWKSWMPTSVDNHSLTVRQVPIIRNGLLAQLSRNPVSESSTGTSAGLHRCADLS